MRDGYEKVKSRESARANERQKMFEEHHGSNNAFVRKHEAMAATLAGKMPNLEGRYMNFNAEMMNNGMHAQEFARELTHGLDEKAFPVK
jgi:hypothetical protein